MKLPGWKASKPVRNGVRSDVDVPAPNCVHPLRASEPRFGFAFSEKAVIPLPVARLVFFPCHQLCVLPNRGFFLACCKLPRGPKKPTAAAVAPLEGKKVLSSSIASLSVRPAEISGVHATNNVAADAPSSGRSTPRAGGSVCGNVQ
ncbi:hypothetical protein PG994_011940 [Apiospora phragmitis]|uniref:Uncharacterized protein n=1 Tax=Apiospora phragmitis TaxID=2905665 RepID=A0ABR1TWG7_9PEZI